MKIYVSHSSKIDYKKELYDVLRNSDLAKQHEFLLPHERGLDLFPTKQLFDNHGCDLVFAEVSFPSHGQGVELGWAYDRGIRMVFAHKPEAKLSVVMPELSKEIFSYKDSQDLINKLSSYLQ
jgi:hypothetical protein